MPNNIVSNNSLFRDVWISFRAMPLWVQLWMCFWLMPVNMASMFFLDQPQGVWVAFLTNIGMILNLPVIIYYRGMSKAMALPHLLPWTVLVVLAYMIQDSASGQYAPYLRIVMVTNIISLMFDYPDSLKWWRGDRQVVGRN